MNATVQTTIATRERTVTFPALVAGPEGSASVAELARALGRPAGAFSRAIREELVRTEPDPSQIGARSVTQWVSVWSSDPIL